MCNPTMKSEFKKCSKCGKTFKHMWVSDPRKGYDLLNESPKAWRIRCKGCERNLTVQKQETVQIRS